MARYTEPHPLEIVQNGALPSYYISYRSANLLEEQYREAQGSQFADFGKS